MMALTMMGMVSEKEARVLRLRGGEDRRPGCGDFGKERNAGQGVETLGRRGMQARV